MYKTYIFDLDNTLCDTWPTLKSRKKTNIFLRFFIESWRISFIPSFPNMMMVVNKRMNRIDTDVFFLSARHWSLWPFTYLYLVRHIGLLNPLKLILVPTAYDKLKKIETFLSVKNKLIIIDDLSYNTENGKTLFYKDIIENFNNNNKIKYIDKNKIDLINKLN